MTKKSKGSIILSIVLIAAVFSINVFSQSYNWYFKPTGDHTQPIMTPEAKFVEKYDVITIGEATEKKIYLTFDAGYENGNVEKILDTLKSENVPGAFFILPQIMKDSPELIKRMRNEGHLICNHSKSHRNMSTVSDFETFESEIRGAEASLKEYTGLEMDKYYRPPEGAFSEKNLEFAQKLGYKTVFWSLAYADWDNNKQMDGKKALDLLLSRVHNGCVLLLHPTSATNAEILPQFIKELKSQGYEFCSITDFERGDDIE